MTKRYLVNAVVGTLAERPDPSTPSGGASETPFGLYLDTDTGDIYESTGKDWVRLGTLAGNGAASISGLSSDEELPAGLIVDGAFSAAGGHFTVSDVGSNPGGMVAGDSGASAANAPGHALYGNSIVQSIAGQNLPALQVQQQDALPSTERGQALYVVRVGDPGAFSYTKPVVKIEDFATDTQPYLQTQNGSGVGHTLGQAGGLGIFGHAAPAAPRTLAQSVITAITDANAKTAVQALANALSDMGALTLT